MTPALSKFVFVMLAIGAGTSFATNTHAVSAAKRLNGVTEVRGKLHCCSYH